ncbi:Carotenoid oxygenase - like 8 [Theobroma cacao]|nr:Carotenoid oxygenase - like 8 [Theobroma cacao]
MTDHMNLMNGFGMANTGLAFFSDHFFALCESDLPHIINLMPKGDIETLGRWEFEKKWSLSFPYLTFFCFDGNSVKQNEVPIFSINQPCFIHDFAITKLFAIFHETQLVYSLGKVMTRKGTLVHYEPNKTPRIGITPKYAMNDSEMR